jgi:hypothetical protein
MDENAKRRFDSIAVLWEGCRRRREERRSYELKLSLSLWTAFALGSAGFGKQGLPPTLGGRIP